MEGAIGCFFSSATIERCTFIENEDNIAGAIHVGAEADSGGFVSIRDCVFIDNHSSSDGGAVLFADTPGELLNCTLMNNTADKSGGAIVATLRTVLEIANTTVVGNSSPKASGLYIGSGADVTIHHSIIAFGRIGAAVECDTPSVVFDSVEVVVQCSDVFANEGGDWISCLQGLEKLDGNISDDPLFCSLLEGDLRLTPGSPCYQASCGLMGAFSVGCSGPFAALVPRRPPSAR
jgi:predicted outer membrane repeat protein